MNELNEFIVIISLLITFLYGFVILYICLYTVFEDFMSLIFFARIIGQEKAFASREY
jgi:hypothetical protein